jgi:hypothetical protein
MVQRVQRPRTMRLILSILSLSAIVGASQAQTPVVTKLEQHEATYQAKLRELHRPLLDEYVTRLKTITVPAEHQAALNSELERALAMQAKGVIELQPTAPEPPPPTKRMATQNLMAKASPNTPIGSGSWPTKPLQAGNYEIIILAACPALDPDPTLTITLATQTIQANITPGQTTTSATNHRLISLGTISLATDLGPSTFVISSPAIKPWLWLKQVMIRPIK